MLTKIVLKAFFNLKIDANTKISRNLLITQTYSWLTVENLKFYDPIFIFTMLWFAQIRAL